MRLLLLLGVLWFVHLSSAQTLLEWLQGSNHPKNLKKSLALTPTVQDLLSQASFGGRHFVVILPEDQAWKPKENHPDLYAKILKNPSLAQQLLFDAVAEVGKKVNSLKDLKGEYLETLSGTPLLLEGEKLYHAKHMPDGSLKKVNKSLPIRPKPVVVLEDATIFASTQIRLPEEIRHDEQ